MRAFLFAAILALSAPAASQDMPFDVNDAGIQENFEWIAREIKKNRSDTFDLRRTTPTVVTTDITPIVISSTSVDQTLTNSFSWQGIDSTTTTVVMNGTNQVKISGYILIEGASSGGNEYTIRIMDGDTILSIVCAGQAVGVGADVPCKFEYVTADTSGTKTYSLMFLSGSATFLAENSRAPLQMYVQEQ